MSDKFEIKALAISKKVFDAVRRKRPNVPVEVIKNSLSRNILTVLQLCELTGETQNRILILSAGKENVKAHKNKPTLSRVYPFRTADKYGPVFIVRDENCNAFILERNQ